jgi:hypothetical protein
LQKHRDSESPRSPSSEVIGLGICSARAACTRLESSFLKPCPKSSS